METNELFSKDPLENIKIENDFLRLKLKAQFGDAFYMGSDASLPPEIENQFLKNIIAFEEEHANAEQTTVYKSIGMPGYRSVGELTEAEIAGELVRLIRIMGEHQIALDICDGPYPDKLIYTFITEELFVQEITKMPGSGGAWHFIYEEFHPNDRAEIEKNTHGFLGDWFAREFNEFDTAHSWHFITADGRQLTRENLMEKIQLFFDAFVEFKDDGYNIDEIKFEMYDDGRGLGHAEGMLKYDAVMENREIIHYEGPYKLYMQREDKYWSIFYFVMPGFTW